RTNVGTLVTPQALLQLALLGGLAATAWGNPVDVGSVDIDDIYDGAMTGWGAVQSVVVNYELEHEVLAELPSFEKDDSRPAEGTFRIEFAFDGERRKRVVSQVTGTTKFDSVPFSVYFNGTRSLVYRRGGIAELWPEKHSRLD